MPVTSHFNDPSRPPKKVEKKAARKFFHIYNQFSRKSFLRWLFRLAHLSVGELLNLISINVEFSPFPENWKTKVSIKRIRSTTESDPSVCQHIINLRNKIAYVFYLVFSNFSYDICFSHFSHTINIILLEISSFFCWSPPKRAFHTIFYPLLLVF